MPVLTPLAPRDPVIARFLSPDPERSMYVTLPDISGDEMLYVVSPFRKPKLGKLVIVADPDLPGDMRATVYTSRIAAHPLTHVVLGVVMSNVIRHFR
jgi:hypothetical protein